MKLTELMGYPMEDKSHRLADGVFSIGDHAFDRHFQLVQFFLDFLEQGGQIPLATAEQWTLQQDFF